MYQTFFDRIVFGRAKRSCPDVLKRMDVIIERRTGVGKSLTNVDNYEEADNAVCNALEACLSQGSAFENLLFFGRACGISLDDTQTERWMIKEIAKHKDMVMKKAQQMSQ